MKPKESYRLARAAYGKQIEVPAKMLPESPAVSVTLIIVRLASTVVTLVTVKVFATLSPWQRQRSRGDVPRHGKALRVYARATKTDRAARSDARATRCQCLHCAQSRASGARVAHVVKLVSDAGGIPSRDRGPARVHVRLTGEFAPSRRLGVSHDDARRCGDVPKRAHALDRCGDYGRFATCDRRSVL